MERYERISEGPGVFQLPAQEKSFEQVLGESRVRLIIVPPGVTAGLVASRFVQDSPVPVQVCVQSEYADCASQLQNRMKITLAASPQDALAGDDPRHTILVGDIQNLGIECLLVHDVSHQLTVVTNSELQDIQQFRLWEECFQRTVVYTSFWLSDDELSDAFDRICTEGVEFAPDVRTLVIRNKEPLLGLVKRITNGQPDVVEYCMERLLASRNKHDLQDRAETLQDWLSTNPPGVVRRWQSRLKSLLEDSILLYNTINACIDDIQRNPSSTPTEVLMREIDLYISGWLTVHGEARSKWGIPTNAQRLWGREVIRQILADGSRFK